MYLQSFLVIIIGLTNLINAQNDILYSNDVFGGITRKELKRNFYSTDNEVVYWQTENNVNIKVYYESLCPASKYFVSRILRLTVLQLSQYLNISIYPFGKANITEEDGHYQFQCQHGPLECYGNKLHACAIHELSNMTASVLFNGCMMESADTLGSDDSTADECGHRLNLDSTLIKECAKSDRGSILLKRYGYESKKVHFKYVPYKLINGNESVDSFMEQVCAAFGIPPPPCSNL